MTLEAGDGYYLGGTVSIPYSYTVPITGSNLRVLEITENSIAVTWDSDSDVSTEWTVVCSGDNGYANTLVTSERSAVFEGTEVGATYTIAVNNTTMTVPDAPHRGKLLLPDRVLHRGFRRLLYAP